mmetsp:Transcript_46593/g.88968  ORF Transcript_46593/g.88968 Transcript_46593/m.88968 type:complete len:132 (-) Transcript_46593:240-635(-)
MLPILHRHGYHTALGSVYAHDPQLHAPHLVAAMLKQQAFPGGVMVLHDGGPLRKKSVSILEDVIPSLLRRGYKVVTLSELVRRSKANDYAIGSSTHIGSESVNQKPRISNSMPRKTILHHTSPFVDSLHGN